MANPNLETEVDLSHIVRELWETGLRGGLVPGAWVASAAVVGVTWGKEGPRLLLESQLTGVRMAVTTLESVPRREAGIWALRIATNPPPVQRWRISTATPGPRSLLRAEPISVEGTP